MCAPQAREKFRTRALVAIVGPPQVRMPFAPLLVQVATHDRRMEPPAQPRLVARLALSAGLHTDRTISFIIQEVLIAISL